MTTHRTISLVVFALGLAACSNTPDSQPAQSAPVAAAPVAAAPAPAPVAAPPVTPAPVPPPVIVERPDPRRDRDRRPPVHMLAAGTPIEVTINSDITSRSNHVGDAVAASITRDVRDDRGRVVIRQNAPVSVRIAAISSARGRGGRADGTVELTVTALQVMGETHRMNIAVLDVARTMRDRNDSRGRGDARGRGGDMQRDVVVERGARFTFALPNAIQLR